MSYERSVGAIIYRVRAEGRERTPFYLLLRYPGEYWEFARGHVEEGEREHATAKREIREETGLTGLQFRKGFREQYRFHFKRKGRMIAKDAILYLAQSRSWNVRVSAEHYGYAWFSYREALKHLRFDNSKNVMKRAQEFLERGQRPPALPTENQGSAS
jgi:bis(5'-nucleosidyl)-tetraphosphatase